MAMGMTYEQYWYGDPWAVVSFRRAHELRKKMTNEQMWLMGLYVNSAVQSAVSAFGKNPRPYMKEPIDVEAHIDTEKEKQKAINYYKALELAWAQKGAIDGGRSDSN